MESASPASIFQQINLRMLRHETSSYSNLMLPSSISQLWNVQILIVRITSLALHFAPPEIWKMSQLRHLMCTRVFLPDPPPSRQQDELVLPHLQTLLKVVNFRWSEEVCKRIPNIKKLQADYQYSAHGGQEEISYYCLHNLGRLRELKSLKCFFDLPFYRRSDMLQSLKFPSSLRKLSLKHCMLYWEDLTMIGSLPHLEVLKLQKYSVRGREWNPVEGEFLRLKILEIKACDLIYWTAESCHFPVLEKLVLHRLDKLDDIPLGVGEIPTLGLIRLVFCSESSAFSAMQILQKQESLENESLEVQVRFYLKSEMEIFKEKMEAENFTSNNFILEADRDEIPYDDYDWYDWH